MAIRLQSEFTSQNGDDYKIEIHDSEWLGGTSTFTVSGNGFSLDYTGETDDIISPIISSFLSVSAFVENAAFETFISNLSEYQDKRFHLEVFKDNGGYELFWVGWITQDLINQEDVSMPYILEIKATDGLGFLANIDYTDINPLTINGAGGLTKITDFLRLSLDKIGLKASWSTSDVYLETSVDWWETTSQTYSTTKDTLSEQGLDVTAFKGVDDNGDVTYTKVLEIVRQIAIIYNARIYQSGGRWVFEQYGNRAAISRYVTTYKKDGVVISTASVSDDITLDQTTAGGARLSNGEFSHLPAVSKVTIDYIQEKLSPNSPPYKFINGASTHTLGAIEGGAGVQLSMEGAHNYTITSTTGATANDGLIAVLFKVQIRIDDASNPGTFHYWTNTFNGYNVASTAVFSTGSWSTTAGFFYYSLPFSKVFFGETASSVGPTIITTDLPVSGELTVIHQLYNKYDPASGSAYTLAGHQTENWSTIITFSRLEDGRVAGQKVSYSASNTNSAVDSNIELKLGDVSVSSGLFQIGSIVVYNGTSWVAGVAFRKGSTGTAYTMLTLSCTEAAALHYSTVKVYDGTIIYSDIFRKRLAFDSSLYLPISASFNASNDEWSISCFAIDRDTTTIGDIDPIEVPALRTPQGVSGISNNPDVINTGRIGGMNVDVTQDRLGPFQQVTGGAAIVGGLKDGEGSFGSSGQVLSSTVTGLSWITSASSNDYVTGMTFNTSDGIVTLTRSGGLADITTDLDGRYLTTHPAIPNSGSIDNSNGVVVQDITIDAYGHSTAWGTVDLDDRFMQLGDPQVVTVKNMEATATLAKGTPVYAVDPSSSGNIVGVKAADASSSATMPAVVIMNESVTAGSEGEALIVGVITGVDTSSFTSGDVVYVASGGGFTNVKPTGTNLIQNLGVVMKVHATNGSGVIYGSGRANDVPNIPNSQAWVGNASGVATPTTLSITNWNTAYTYSTVGHLPLAGGTLTGGLTGTTATFSGQVTIPAVPVSNTDAASKQYIDNKVAGALIYLGTWNASTNTPTLVSGTGTVGTYYIVATDGTTTLDGISDWITGDWAVFSDLPTDAWQKIDNTSILGGAGTGGNIAAWSGSGTSVTLTDAPITYSGSNTTFAGNIDVQGNSATIGSSSQTTTTLNLTATNTAGAPANAVEIVMTGYEGRGIGTFYKDTTYTGAEWFGGIIYAGSFANYAIGYDATGGQAEYAANSLLTIYKTGNATFVGTLTASGYNDTNWNTAYTYSTVGHLPLAGGTLTGNVVFSNNTELRWKDNGGTERTVLELDSSNNLYLGKSGGGTVNIVSGTSYTTAASFDSAQNATFAGDVSLADNKKLKIGTGGDIQIFNDTSSSFIDSYNQNLFIRSLTADKDILFQADNGSGGIATYFYLDGSGTRTIFEKLTRHNDNVRADFGTDSDLRIFHDGSDSYIQSSGTGDIIIQQRTDDKDIVFQSDDGSGGVDTYLRLDGSIESLVAYKDLLMAVDGNGGKLKFGASQDLQIYHDGNSKIETSTGSAGDFFITAQGTNHDLYLQAADNIYIRPQGSEDGIIVVGNGGVQLYYDNVRKFETTSTGVTVTGVVTATGGTSTQWNTAYGWGDHAGLYLRLAGDTMAGTIEMGANNINFTDLGKARFGTSADLQVYHDGIHSYVSDVGQGNLILKGSNLNLRDANNVLYLEALQGGAVTIRHNGGVKLATSSTGVTVTGVVTATGGTSTQWNTAYGWGNHAGLYLSLGGGTMSGDVDMGGNRITDGVFVTQSGTSDDFVKGDGTLDSTAYLALTGGTLSGDVTFTGATHHAMWDKSASALEFWDNAKLTFGDPGGTPDLSDLPRWKQQLYKRYRNREP